MNDPDWTYADDLEDILQRMEDWTESQNRQGEVGGEVMVNGKATAGALEGGN